MSLPFALNPALENLPVYQPGRPIEEVARELGLDERRVIKLASNENPLGPSPAALAVLKLAAKKLNLYPDGNAFYLKQKLAAKLQVAPANLILGNGSNEILEFLAHALLRPGVDAVMSEFCFVVYPLVTRLLGANPVTVPARQYAHDLPAMLKAVTPVTKAVFIANPNNPTGTLAPAREILEFLDQVPPGVVVIMDEAYIEFLEEPLDLVPLVLSGDKPNLILLRTFSKVYGLAGLRLGYGIGHPDLIAALEKIRQPFNVNSLAQVAGLAALDDTAHVQKTRENNSAGRKFFEETLRRMGIEFIPTHANFILARVGPPSTPPPSASSIPSPHEVGRGPGRGDPSIQGSQGQNAPPGAVEGKRVFEELQSRGVIVRPMAAYGLPEWIRISIGSPRENHRCARALKTVLHKKT
ncbi:MAG: histidinol-phosphate transaminase [Verrucomicrobiota bacterium]|jgi:histidinol-phosphate aminotransferase